MTAKRQFKHSAQKQAPAQFNYTDQVKKIWEDFPDTIDRVYFIEVNNQDISLIYPGDPEKYQTLINTVSQSKSFCDFLEKVQTVKKSSFSLPTSYQGKASIFVLLYTEKSAHAFLSDTATQAQVTTFTLDHELGHAIIPEAAKHENHNLRESICDAYAVIRHFQRYGTDSHEIDDLPLYRLFNWFANLGTAQKHFTSPVVNALLAQRHKVAWDQLTSHETAEIALQFAVQHALSPPELEAIDNLFKHCDASLQKLQSGDLTPFQTLESEMRTISDTATAQWAASLLDFVADDGLLKTYGITIPPHGRKKSCQVRKFNYTKKT